eukprot:6194747-Pleurochrysis_carterae.AAC.1
MASRGRVYGTAPALDVHSKRACFTRTVEPLSIVARASWLMIDDHVLRDVARKHTATVLVARAAVARRTRWTFHADRSALTRVRLRACVAAMRARFQMGSKART